MGRVTISGRVLVLAGVYDRVIEARKAQLEAFGFVVYIR